MSEKTLKTNNELITINVQGEPGELYEIFNSKTGDVVEIFFHKEEGVTHETLLAILLDRLNGLHKKYSNEKKHDKAMYSLKKSIFHLEKVINELGHVKDCVNG